MAVLTLRPDGDSGAQYLTPYQSESHYANVDEAVEDTGDYNYRIGTYLTDRYTLQDHTTQTAAITNVTVKARANSLSGNIKLGVKIGASDYGMTEQTLDIADTTYSQSFDTYPVDSSTWTWAEIDALIAVLSLAASGGVMAACYQLWVEVTDTSQTYELSCTDGLKAGDTPANIANMNNSLTDGVKLSDSAVMGFFYLLAAVDGLKISDSTLHDYIANPTLVDGAKLSESLSTWLQSYPTATDGVKLSEVLTTLKQTFPSLSDGTTLSDAAAHFLTLSLSALDGVKLSDIATHYLTLSLSATDGVKVSDLTSIYGALVIYALLELYSRALIARLHKRDTTVIQEE